MEQKKSRVDIGINKVLGIPEPVVDASADSPVKLPKKAVSEDHQKDYVEVRENLKRVIIQSESAIEGVLEVAAETQNARAYEVAAQLIQATLEANNKLMNLHKQMKELVKEDIGKQITTNNNIFVGNTTELSNFLKARKQLETIIDVEVIDDP